MQFALSARLFAALMLSHACALPLAHAQAYPARPIRILVGFPPGGPTDVLARIVGDKMAEQMGQPAIVDNRPGAAGNIAAELTAKATPDGHTILYSSNAIAVSPALYQKLGFDPAKDLLPITETGTSSLVLLVHPALPIQSVSALVDYAKARPGQVNYASSGTGTSTHLAAVLFSQQTGIQTQHVPYKGTAPSLVDIIAGRVQFLMGAISTAIPHIKDGRLRALAVTGAKRSSALPDLRTLGESDVPVEVNTWQGVFAPAGLPPAIAARLNAELARAVRSPELKPRLLQLDMEPTGLGLKEFNAAYRKELARWAKVAKDAGIKPE